MVCALHYIMHPPVTKHLSLYVVVVVFVVVVREASGYLPWVYDLFIYYLAQVFLGVTVSRVAQDSPAAAVKLIVESVKKSCQQSLQEIFALWFVGHVSQYVV